MTNFFTKLFKKPLTGDRSFTLTDLIPQDRNSLGLLKSYGDVGWWHAGLFQTALSCSEVKWTLNDVTQPDKPKQIFNHKALKTLKHVNPFQTSNEFIALHILYMELVGEAFWVISYDGSGEPAELVLAYPNKMSIVPDKYFPMVKGYVYGSGANAIPLNPNEVIHFKYPNPLDQYRGMGNAQPISVDLDNQKYQGEWNRKFWFNSARPDLFLIPDGNFSDEQFDAFTKKWKEKYQGVNKAHQVALVQGIKDVKTISTSAKDMDFSNLQLRGRDILLGILGMPQSSLGISENVNKANAEAGEYQLARRIVKPRLDWIKSKLQEQYIPKFKNSENLEISFEEVVPETAEQKNLLAKDGVMSGIIRVNEARKMRGEDPIPGEYGNSFLVPQSYSVVTDTGEILLQPNQTQQNEPETPETPKGKGLTLRDELRAKFASKTSAQEEEFKKIFEEEFQSQRDIVINQFKETGKLPNLDNEETAKKFKPAIKQVYTEAFNEAAQ